MQLGTGGFVLPITWALRKNSPYLDAFNKGSGLQQLVEVFCYVIVCFYLTVL